MKYLKKYNLIKEGIVEDQFKFGNMVMDLIIKENPIIYDVDDVMNEINDILGHDVVPFYEVFVWEDSKKYFAFDIHQKEWWDYHGYPLSEGDYDDLKGDLEDAQKELIKIRNGEYTDFRLQVNYQYTNSSNNFEPDERTDELNKAIKQVRKHLTNIGCEIQDNSFGYRLMIDINPARHENMDDKFWGLKIMIPIKLSQSNNLDVIDGLTEGVIKDFNQFIMDYKIDEIKQSKKG